MLSDLMQVPAITPEYLSTLDKEQLCDLLVHKTGLLVKITVLKVPNTEYIEDLKQEVQKLQEAIRNFPTR